MKCLLMMTPMRFHKDKDVQKSSLLCVDVYSLLQNVKQIFLSKALKVVTNIIHYIGLSLSNRPGQKNDA